MKGHHCVRYCQNQSSTRSTLRSICQRHHSDLCPDFLAKTLTVKYRLVQGHHCRRKHNQDCHASLGAPDAPGCANPPHRFPTRRSCSFCIVCLTAISPNNPKICHVTQRLHQIQHALSSGEPVLLLQRLEPVDVVHSAIQLIRNPDRPVKGAARHAVRPEEHIASVPYHKRERDGKPYQRQIRWSVSPHSRGIACRLFRPSLRPCLRSGRRSGRVDIRCRSSERFSRRVGGRREG